MGARMLGNFIFCDKLLTIRQDACNQEYGRFPLK